jgi:predicted ester cyclase
VAAGLNGAIPDMKLTIEEIIASGDKTRARITGRGTHRVPLMGFAPIEIGTQSRERFQSIKELKR